MQKLKMVGAVPPPNCPVCTELWKSSPDHKIRVMTLSTEFRNKMCRSCHYRIRLTKDPKAKPFCCRCDEVEPLEGTKYCGKNDCQNARQAEEHNDEGLARLPPSSRQIVEEHRKRLQAFEQQEAKERQAILDDWRIRHPELFD